MWSFSRNLSVLTIALTGFTSAQNSVRAATNEAPPSVATIQNIYVDIAQKLNPSVVNIYTTATVRAPNDVWQWFFDDPFTSPRRGFRHAPPASPEPKSRPMSLGSGFIIEVQGKEALILTNHHVVQGADEIAVKFTEKPDEKKTPAQLVGGDPELDIALLKVKTDRELMPVQLGDSEALKVGAWIAAIGNPFGHGHSISHGIVSAKARTLPGSFSRYLQVDAPINPGNSGGPLVDLNGQVVGINNAIDARGPGIGFAIPINDVKRILPDLKNKGSVDRGYIGVNIGPINSEIARTLKLDHEVNGSIVTHVVPGHPADLAGIRPYDVITEADGKSILGPDDLVRAIANTPIGRKIQVKVLRSGKSQAFEIQVGKRA